MRFPFNGSFRLTQGFGENPASYAKFGMSSIANLSYLDIRGDIVAPDFGKSSLGILYTRIGRLFIKPIQTAKSKLSELRLKVHQPIVFLTGLPFFILRLYSSHTFKSIFSLFHKKSKEVFSDLRGLLALNFLINHSSHSMPFWGLPAKKLFLAELLRRYHARLLQTSEQYLVFAKDSLFNLIGFEQNKQSISRLYRFKRHNTI